MGRLSNPARAKLEAAILAVLAEGELAWNGQAALESAVGVGRDALATALRRLVRRGVIEQVMPARRGQRIVWRLVKADGVDPAAS